MGYFPCDIPFMSDEELEENGLSRLKSDVDPDTISRKAVIDGFNNLDIMLRPSDIYKIFCMIEGIPPKEDSDATK
jgi:hypothetical protein